jgi:hypothetical protein
MIVKNPHSPLSGAFTGVKVSLVITSFDRTETSKPWPAEAFTDLRDLNQAE